MKSVVEILFENSYYEVIKATYPSGAVRFYLLKSDLGVAERTIAFVVSSEDVNNIINSDGDWSVVLPLTNPRYAEYAYVDEFDMWPLRDQWIRKDTNSKK